MAPSALRLLAWAGALLGPAAAQFPPEPTDVKVIKSKFDERITISYKEPGICETTEGVKSYAGYIHLPPGTLEGGYPEQEHPINTFFWFFEAREDPENAPLSFWMNGGPGASSMPGLLYENGPCFLNPDSQTTSLNEFSWNNKVNMLYIDQPVQAGFSYDILRNVTSDLLGDVETLEPSDPIPETNTTFHVGTFSSGDSNSTSLGSRNGAIAIWHFSQVFFTEFPGYHPKDDRISVSSQSYGGRYGPAIGAYFQEQNEKISNGTYDDLPGPNHILNLDSVLIVNGCIDRRVQWPYYPEMAFNNSYGIEAVNETVYLDMVAAWDRPGGCRDQIDECRELSVLHDPENLGVNASVNAVCQAAETYCTNHMRDPYLELSGRDYYDVTQVDPTLFPLPYSPGYLNQRSVQEALGVPLNWTGSSSEISISYRGIGDYNKPGWIEDLGYLLDVGTKVHMMYGDRDFACPYNSGAAVGLAIPWEGQEGYESAGYAPLYINETFDGGLVRQYGNLSYARVFQAGHAVPSYQPETAYQIFTRLMFDKDVATGEVDTAGTPDYATEGPSEMDVTHEIPPQYPDFCYILDPSTCSDEQVDALRHGNATIVDYVMTNPPFRREAAASHRMMRRSPEFMDPDLRV